MRPTYSQGDLILFTAISQTNIANRTIVVYVPRQTGLPFIDALIKPIVVHRIIGKVVQPDGVVYYRTKGDDNQFNDPAIVRYTDILGTPIAVMPMVGIALLFLRSPQGLIVAVGAITFLYLSKYEPVIAQMEKRKKLLAVFAEMALNGQISSALFEKLKLVTEYADKLPFDALKDPNSLALSDFIRRGGLARDWRHDKTDCPRCLGSATVIRSRRDLYFLFCPRCQDQAKLEAR